VEFGLFGVGMYTRTQPRRSTVANKRPKSLGECVARDSR